MKHIIKKILKEESLKQTLKQQVKEFGFKDTAELVGGAENLIKLGFNNDPMEFLNLFNDLDVVQSEEEPNWVLYRYKKGHNFMIYDRKNGDVYINYYGIWSVLHHGFGLNYDEIQSLTETWLDEVYNLRGITTPKLLMHRLLHVG
jgi:hypothetical protein